MADEEMQELMEELNELSSSEDKSNYGSPSPANKDSIFKFFKEMIKLPESWKVGNLREEEIGKSRLTIRSYLDLATYAESEGFDTIVKYFKDKARNVSDPTLGRKGFFLQTAVTQIKKEQKLKDPVQKKRGLFFGGGNNETEQQQ